MKGKDVILGLKFDTLEKHARKTKVIRNMPHLGKEQKEFYVNKKCSHAKNEVTYSQRNHITIVKHVIQGGLKWEREKKRQQFATILHMLQHGKPMLEFEAMKPLFSFLNVLMNPENH
jgi:hypothetical protein